MQGKSLRVIYLLCKLGDLVTTVAAAAMARASAPKRSRRRNSLESGLIPLDSDLITSKILPTKFDFVNGIILYFAN